MVLLEGMVLIALLLTIVLIILLIIFAMKPKRPVVRKRVSKDLNDIKKQISE